MKRQLFRASVLASLILATAGCTSSPYKIIDSKQEGPLGLVTSVRVDVPATATKEQLQDWCDEITKSEGDGEGVVNIEFLEEGGVIRQKGVCFGGKVYMN